MMDDALYMTKIVLILQRYCFNKNDPVITIAATTRAFSKHNPIFQAIYWQAIAIFVQWTQAKHRLYANDKSYQRKFT